MSTYTQILYQIVFGTKHRAHTLSNTNNDELYKYMSGILAKKGCHLYRIGGVSDHVHIVTHIHPTIPLSSLIHDIKIASSLYIKAQKLYPHFSDWQEGYGAFTYAFRDRDNLINYVKDQAKHHQKKSFREEYVELLNEHGIEFDEKYLL